MVCNPLLEIVLLQYTFLPLFSLHSHCQLPTAALITFFPWDAVIIATTIDYLLEAKCSSYIILFNVPKTLGDKQY